MSGQSSARNGGRPGSTRSFAVARGHLSPPRRPPPLPPRPPTNMMSRDRWGGEKKAPLRTPRQPTWSCVRAEGRQGWKHGFSSPGRPCFLTLKGSTTAYFFSELHYELHSMKFGKTCSWRSWSGTRTVESNIICTFPPSLSKSFLPCRVLIAKLSCSFSPPPWRTASTPKITSAEPSDLTYPLPLPSGGVAGRREYPDRMRAPPLVSSSYCSPPPRGGFLRSSTPRPSGG